MERLFSPHQEELKAKFIQERGYWADFWDGLLLLDPDYFEAILEMTAVPWRKGFIEPKIKELIYIAIDASTTHLYEPGLRVHIKNAFKYGATKEEVLEVYELVSVLGNHTLTMGIPVLLQELEIVEGPSTEQGFTEHQEELKAKFIQERGYWADFWDGLLLLDPDYFAAVLEMTAVPWRKGFIEPKIKEFIYIAIDSATTHLYEPGLRVHIKNAFKYGATKEEILEVYELVSVLGNHTLTMGIPVLIEELEILGEKT